MQKGKLLDNGMTAEVFEWGRDKVVKLFFERFSEDWIKHEAKIGNAVHEAEVPSPAVFEIVDVDGRKGIVFERIQGKTMLQHIQKEPWKLYYFAQQLAGLQYKIHQYSAADLPTQKEKFFVRISSANKILGNKMKIILDYVDSLPDGNSVCHGDLHFNNIILSDHAIIPVDWMNAYRGNPLGDVARTCLMMRSPSKPPAISDTTMMMFQYAKWLTYWAYLNEYRRLAKVGYESIDAWILPVAAAKIKDNIPGEEKWLMDIINKQLEQL